jgi:hypothetical protein
MNASDISREVYVLNATPSAFCDFAFARAEDIALFDCFDGRSLTASWKPVPITAADEPDDEAELGDFAFLGTMPMLSERAARALCPLLAGQAELLPVVYPRRTYFCLNVTRVIDALDEEASTVERFASSGRVMSVDRFVFRSEPLVDATIFRIPQLLRSLTFVTDAVSRVVRREELLGFDLERVWSSVNA